MQLCNGELIIVGGNCKIWSIKQKALNGALDKKTVVLGLLNVSVGSILLGSEGSNSTGGKNKKSAGVEWRAAC